MIIVNIKILDTTLRDGEQTPGVSLTPLEKLRIATKLDEIGVEYIEAGSAITSEGERESIKQITKQDFKAEILSFSRPLTVDIDYCLDCDVDGVNLVVPTSELHIRDKLKTTSDKLIELSNNAVDYCKDHGLIVELSAEDASRSDFNFLKDVYLNAISHGADRVCVCDTVGILTPDSSFELFSKLSDLSHSGSPPPRQGPGPPRHWTLPSARRLLPPTRAFRREKGAGEGKRGCEDTVGARRPASGQERRGWGGASPPTARLGPGRGLKQKSMIGRIKIKVN